MKLSFTKGMLVPIVATVSLLAGVSLVTVTSAGAVNPPNIIAGAVTDASSNPIAGLCVNLDAVTGGAPLDQTTTGSDGSFVMTGMPEGNYYVVTGCDGGGDGTDDSIYAQQTTSVTMTSGTVDVPTITMFYGGGVSGTVEFDGAPVDGVCVDADPTVPTPSEPSIGISTSSDGEYWISGLSAVSYDINVWSSSSAGPCTTDDQTVAVTISAGTVLTQNVILTSAPATTGTISGTITDNTTGDPVSGICVDVIAPTGGAPLYSSVTASDGSYSIPNVVAGSYSLNSFSGCGSTTIYATTLTPSVDVTASATTTANVTMLPGGAISGIVTDSTSGDPIGGVCVTATSSSSSFEASSSSTGAYDLVGLPVDSYSVTADPTCAGMVTSVYNSASSTDEVTANSTTADDITLTPTTPTVAPSSPPSQPVTTTTPPLPPVTTPPATTTPAAPPTPTKPRVVTPGLRVVGVAHVGRSSELRIVGMTFSAPKKIVSNARDTTVRLVRDPKSYLLVRVIADDKAPSGEHIITIVLHSGKKVRVSYTQDAVRKTSTTSPATTPTAPTTITPPATVPTTPTTPTVTTPTTDTVNFDSEGGSSVASMTGEAGSTITLPSAPTYSGYNFDGWFSSPANGTEATSPYALTSSVTLYAQWTAAAPFQGAYSSNWSGYVLPVTDNAVNSVSGSWTVPTLNCTATPDGSAGMWVGLNGVEGTDPLLQTGTGSFCSDGVQINQAWWEVVPAPNASLVFSQLPVSPGDQMTAKVFENSSGQWVTQLQDLTTGLEGVMISGENWQVVDIATEAVVAIDGTADPYNYAGVTSAEWIVEAPTSGNSIETLADFGTVGFTNLQANDTTPMLTPHDAVDMFNAASHVVTAESPVSDGAFNESYVGPVMAAEMGNVVASVAGRGFSTREDW